MNRSAKRWIIAVALLLVFIWGNSVLPVKESATVSKGLVALINRIISELGGAEQASNHLLRKTAHVTELGRGADKILDYASPKFLLYSNGLCPLRELLIRLSRYQII